MSKESDLDVKAALVRTFIANEVPTAAQWNENKSILHDVIALLGDFFTDTDGKATTLKARVDLEHDGTGRHTITQWLTAPPEWVTETATPTFLNAFTFSLPGDRRPDYDAGYRVRATLGGSNVVVGIVGVVFDAAPNRTLIAVSPATLNSSLSVIARGIVRTSQPLVGAADLRQNAVTTLTIVDRNVTTAKLAVGAVGNTELALNAVAAGNIQNGQVTNAKIPVNELTGDRFVDATIPGTKIQSGTVTGAQLATNTVTNSRISNATIDGGAKIAAGSITEGNLSVGLLGNIALHNLLRDGSFESWSNGTGAAPDGWTLFGTGTVAQRTDDQRFGTSSAEHTHSAVAGNEGLRQTAFTISATTNPELRGKLVSCVAWLKPSAASTGRLRIFDGVSEALSTFAPANVWTRVVAAAQLDANATELTVEIVNAGATGATVRMDAAMLVFGIAAPAMFRGQATDTALDATRVQDAAGVARVLVGPVMQAGWGYLTVPVGNDYLLKKAITFPNAFRGRPYAVHATCIGRKPSGAPPAHIADATPWPSTGVSTNVASFPSVEVDGGSPSTTGMTVVVIHVAGDQLDDGEHILFSWWALGVLP